MARVVALIVLLFLVRPLQCSAQNAITDSLDTGYLVLGGGGSRDSIGKRFVELAGGPDAEFVIIHVPSSREPKDDRPLGERVASVSEMRSALAFGVKKMTSLRFSERKAADSNEFNAPIRNANGVRLTGGDVDRLVKETGGSLLQRELKGVLQRGGVVGGESAGAIVLTSEISRNIKGVPPGAKPDTSLYEGYGFIKGIVVVPHLVRMGWQESLVPVIEAHPDLLGIGIDEGAAVVAHKGTLEVIGANKVAVYDNAEHDGKRYYFLSDGDRFDLAKRHLVPRSGPDSAKQ